MICPQCHAEYLSHIKICGNYNVDLIEASNIDLPITDMDWISPAYLVGASSLPNQIIRIFVPKEYLRKASSFKDSVIGETN